MADYIDRDTAIKIVSTEGYNIHDILFALKTIPAHRMVHARWVESDLDADCVTCSNCKRLKLKNRMAFTQLAFEEWGLNYCPNCGAMMDGNT